MGGKHGGGGSTDRPYDEDEDRKTLGSTHDQSPETQGGTHGKPKDKK
ncbi:hypothetical protein ACWEPC_21230 [Nonomuraea sp. NPDC004297]